MNFFYSIKSNNILSKLTIPKFKNQNYVDKSNQLFVADINNNKWEISKITTEENNDISSFHASCHKLSSFNLSSIQELI